MGEALTIIGLILPILNQLPALIHTAEQAFSGVDKSGAAKKQLVMQVVGTGIAAASAAGVTEIQNPQTQQIVTTAASSLADTIVAGYNATGVFKKAA